MTPPRQGDNTTQAMTRIIIIGYMGAGKTTVGKALARELGLQFYDLDWYIEARMHKTVPQLFAERGEQGFRQVERAMLHEAAEFEDVVLSCGGGTPCFFDNIDYMNSRGPVVYLKATPEVLHSHLMMGKTERPLIKGKTGDELTGFIARQLGGGAGRGGHQEAARRLTDAAGGNARTAGARLNHTHHRNPTTQRENEKVDH